MAQYIFFILLTNINIKYVRVLNNKVLIFQEPLCFLETSEEKLKDDGLSNDFISLSRVSTKFKFEFANDKPLKQLIGSPYTEIKQFDFILMKEESSMFDQENLIFTFQVVTKKLNFRFSEPEFLYLYSKNFLKDSSSVKPRCLVNRPISSSFIKKKSLEVRKVYESKLSDELLQMTIYQRDTLTTLENKNKLIIKNFLTREVFKVQFNLLRGNLNTQTFLFFARNINKRKNGVPAGQNIMSQLKKMWLINQRRNFFVNSMAVSFDSPFRGSEISINKEKITKSTFDTVDGETRLVFFQPSSSLFKGPKCISILESGFGNALGKTKILVDFYSENEDSNNPLDIFFKIKKLGRIFKEPKVIQNTTSSAGRRSGFLYWILGVAIAFFFLTLLFLKVHVVEKTRRELLKKSTKSSNLSKRPLREPLSSSAHGLKIKRALFCFGLFSKQKKAETIESKTNEKSDVPKHKDIDSDIKRLVSFLEEHLAKKKIDYNKKPRTYVEKTQKKLSWMEEGLFYKIRISETMVLKSQEEGHTVKFDESGPYIFYEPPVEKTHVRDYNFYNLLKAYLKGGKANMFGCDFDLSYYFDTCNGLRITIIQMVHYIKEAFPSEKRDRINATPILSCSQDRNELFASLENFLDHLWTKDFEFIENYVYSSDKTRRRLALFMTEANLALINTLESKYGLRKPKIFIKILRWFKKLNRTVKI